MSAANWVPREPSAAERPEAPPVHPSWRRILSVVGWAHPRHKRTDLIFARQGLPALAHCYTRGQPHQHGHRSTPWAGLPTRLSVAVVAGDACASRRLGLLLQRESTTFFVEGRRPWSRYDAMRHPRNRGYVPFARGMRKRLVSIPNPVVSIPQTAFGSAYQSPSPTRSRLLGHAVGHLR